MTTAYAAALAAETANDACDVCGVFFNDLTGEQMNGWHFHHGHNGAVVAETCSAACATAYAKEQK